MIKFLKKGSKQSMQENNGKQGAKNNTLRKKLVIAGSFVIAVALVIVLVVANGQNKELGQYNWEIQRICELATLKCFYHNVAVHEDSGGFLGIGGKQIWLEYDGIITAGVLADQVKIEEPTKDGIVKIYVPRAVLIGISYDKSSIKKPVSDANLFAKITADDESAILNQAQEDMKAEVQTQTYIFDQAYENAKNLLEEHVINVGRMMGKEYKVEWIGEFGS